MSEDYRRLSRKTRRCFDDTPTNLSAILRDKLDSAIIDVFTIEDMENTPLESRVWFRSNSTSGVFSSNTLVCFMEFY